MSEEVKKEVPQTEKPKYILSKESAEIQLKKLFDYYEIELDEMDDQDLKEKIEMGYGRLIKAIRKERLSIKTDGGIQVIQMTRDGKEMITYREIDGKAKTEMAGKNINDFYGRIYAMMGSLSGLGEAAIKQLKGVDLSLVEVLGFIFLAV